MENERNSLEKVKKYLLSLGYPNETIFYEYQTSTKRRIDIVIKSNDVILVIIEVKSRFSLNLDNTDDIGFHPIARILQKEAKELDAKYYILSNGSKSIWLQTSQTGRPEQISEMSFSEFDQSIISKSKYITETLNQFSDFLKRYPITGDHLFNVSLTLYSKLHQEIFGLDKNFINDLDSNLEGHMTLTNKSSVQIINEANYRLEQSDIMLIDHKEVVVQFIDSLFRNVRRELGIPRWLGDFMIKLANLLPNDRVVDLFAQNGVISSSAYLNKINNVLSIYTNKSDTYWIKTFQLLLNKRLSEASLNTSLLYGKTDSIVENYSNVTFLTPPFNVKFPKQHYDDLNHYGIKDSTSIFLEAALNTLEKTGKVVAVIPDGFLLSSIYKKAREYFSNKYHVQTIVSLPSQTFLPFSGVKTSLIIIENVNNNKPTFFASIEKVPKTDLIDCTININIKNIIDKSKAFESGQNIEATKEGFKVEFLDVANFHFSKYWFNSSKVLTNNLSDSYLSLPLKEVIISIERGSSLVIDNSGELPFIGPASIRSMLLDINEVSFTSKTKLPKNVKKVYEGNIIINAIGNYRGNAAIVNSDFNDFAINRHVVVIKANKNMIHSGYLAVALNSAFVQEQFFDKSIGSTIPSLNLKHFEEIFIPIPSMKEQIKIFEDFQELTEKISQIRITLSENESILNNKLRNIGKGDVI